MPRQAGTELTNLCACRLQPNCTASLYSYIVNLRQQCAAHEIECNVCVDRHTSRQSVSEAGQAVETGNAHSSVQRNVVQKHSADCRRLLLCRLTCGGGSCSSGKQRFMRLPGSLLCCCRFRRRRCRCCRRRCCSLSRDCQVGRHGWWVGEVGSRQAFPGAQFQQPLLVQGVDPLVVRSVVSEIGLIR